MVGYNIKIKVNNKTFLGVTSDDLSISARIKESITKDDAGVKNKTVTGHDVTTKASLVAKIDSSSSSSSTTLDRDDIIDLALAVGSAAVLAATYETSEGKDYGGNAIITNCTENSTASPDDEVTISLELDWLTFAATV